MTFLELAQAIDETQVEVSAAEAAFREAQSVVIQREGVYKSLLSRLASLFEEMQSKMGRGAQVPSSDMKALFLEGQKATGRSK